MCYIILTWLLVIMYAQCLFGHIGINNTTVTFISITSGTKSVILCSIFLLMIMVEEKGNSKDH